jgi:hypothetical protein
MCHPRLVTPLPIIDVTAWRDEVATHLAGHLAIPVATTALAVSNGRAGAISASVVDDHEDLIHGRELLFGREPAEGGHHRSDPRYTIEAVEQALQGLDAPVGVPDEMDAFAACGRRVA